MKYAYLYLPGILILLLPVMKAIVDGAKADAKRKRQIAEKGRREAERREALRKANEEREAQKAAEEAAKAAMPKRGPGRPRKDPAEKAAAEAAKAAMPKRKPGRPRKEPAPEQKRPESISPVAQPAEQAPAPVAAEPAAPVAPKRPAAYIGNNLFAGETVAFTGTLPGMTRREAIEAVRKNGGKAYENMPAGTTILVVGDNPGRNKLDNADKWIGSCRKISALEFRIMLDTPLTLTPEQFADYVHAVYAA